MLYKQLISLLTVFTSITVTAAAITVDGTRDTSYGTALATQTINTQFGDSNSGIGGVGGELNAAYAIVENRRLHVIITGNIENNFNKLSLFFDSKTGGENTLSGNPQYDFENISQNFSGLTFDNGFQADYHLYARWGALTGNKFTVDIVDRNGGSNATVAGNGDDTTSADGTGLGTAVQTGIVNPTDMGLGSTGIGEVRNLSPFLTQPLYFGFNNTNTAGVGSGTGAANQAAALAVTTGFEFSIDLFDLGNPSPGDEIKIHAVYGNGNNNFHSNQTLGGLPIGTGNLGGNLSGVNFSNIVGDQFFPVIVPNITGDFNSDNRVDGADFLSWQRGEVSIPPAASDLQDWQANYGNVFIPSPSATATSIPEPCSLALFVLSISLLLCRTDRL